MKNVRLVVVYNRRTISIPFKNIDSIDEFTVYYDTSKDIGLVLNKILYLNQKDSSVKKIYIIKEAERYNKIEYLPVKYSFDNFQYDSVVNNYIDYLIKHEDLLFKHGTALNKITNNYMQKHNKTSLNENDIERIAQLYLKNTDTKYNYNRLRLAYYLLIKEGYKIDIKSLKKENKSINRTDLTKYNPQDDFFEYLIRYSKMGDEEKANAMDFLAGESIDKIDKKMSNPDYSLFDNREIANKIDYGDEALILEALTNMTLQELIDAVNKYHQTEREEPKGKTK